MYFSKFCWLMKVKSQSSMAMTDADRGRPSMMESSPAISPGPRMAKDPLVALRRSYDDFEQTSFKPVATVAGIPGVSSSRKSRLLRAMAQRGLPRAREVLPSG
jgi:hypothetical protein